MADPMTDALDYLNRIPDTTWEVVIGSQGRDEFAQLTLDAGQTIEESWAEALTQAPGPDWGTLCDYRTGDEIRPATEAEHQDSVEAARFDGGRGVIRLHGRPCYVVG